MSVGQVRLIVLYVLGLSNLIGLFLHVGKMEPRLGSSSAVVVHDPTDLPVEQIE